MVKYLVYTLIIIALLLVTFFGIGPVVFADGSLNERLITLLVVLIIYVILGAILVYWIKRNRKYSK